MAKPTDRNQQDERIVTSFENRMHAAEIAQTRANAKFAAAGNGNSIHVPNGDEAIASKAMSFTKGLLHDSDTGLVADPVNEFNTFVAGIDTGNPQFFSDIPKPAPSVFISETLTETKWRAWESSAAGLTFELQGPDSHAVTMPPAPALGSDELIAEIGEVYAQALLRDTHLAIFSIPEENYDENSPGRNRHHDNAQTGNANGFLQQRAEANAIVDCLNKLAYFSSDMRKRGPFSLRTVFRGITPQDQVGPYLSQFMLAGDNGINSAFDSTPEHQAKDGLISFGAQTISQKVRYAKEKNYMTTWEQWLDVQNGADFRGLEEYHSDQRRFITTPRDIATYVHYDALYQAYLNACLLLLNIKAPLGDNIPFRDSDDLDGQQGFALYGGPHVLTLLTEVATRALKAVRYQKFNVHRRLRPEALAGRIERFPSHQGAFPPQIGGVRRAIETCGLAEKLMQNYGNLLLPMAFVEGSPMHPSYGAGHATVAGACVTMLKAFFKYDAYLDIAADGATIAVTESAPTEQYAFLPNHSGSQLRTVKIPQPLTLEGELNKLAANISIGRDWAGVHYYSDYEASLKMGEEIALSILQEQTVCHNPLENLEYTVPKFDGTTLVTIKNGVMSEMAR